MYTFVFSLFGVCGHNLPDLRVFLTKECFRMKPTIFKPSSFPVGLLQSQNVFAFFCFLGTDGPFAASGMVSKLTSCYGKEQPNEKDPAQSLPFGCFIAPQGDSGVSAVMPRHAEPINSSPGSGGS
jgi:hypothetical protein